MTTSSNQITNSLLTFLGAISVLFGTAVFAAGILNTFWGNDPGFGILLLLLSSVYFPSFDKMIRKRFGFSIHPVLKVLLAVFLIMAILGVGELFDKIDLMKEDL